MPDYTYEIRLTDRPVMGVDEVGYGAWAGPVVAAAVYLNISKMAPEGLSQIDDSKKLAPKKRGRVAAFLEELEGESVFSCIQMISSQEIDQMGIKHATHLGMQQAIKGLMDKYPQLGWGGVLVDGLSTPKCLLPIQCIVKGDQKSWSIAAASILAKEARDKMMRDLSHQYPMYGWDTNVGYGTQDHRQGILDYGCCGFHRFSYKPLQGYKELPQVKCG